MSSVNTFNGLYIYIVKALKAKAFDDKAFVGKYRDNNIGAYRCMSTFRFLFIVLSTKKILEM